MESKTRAERKITDQCAHGAHARCNGWYRRIEALKIAERCSCKHHGPAKYRASEGYGND